LNKAVFFTVVYPGVERYFDDFLLSLDQQSKKNFDLYIFNDGLSSLEDYLIPYQKNLNYTMVNVTVDPVKIREQGINLLIDRGYEYIIFGDSDDFFSSNRIKKSIELLDHYDVVVNELSLTNRDGKVIEDNYLSNRLKDGQSIKCPYIREKNIFGLSNTAISTKNLGKVSFPDYVIAVDWLLFSFLLNLGREAIFTSKATTHYRQHASNTVGMRKFSKQGLLRGVQVKSKHYKALAEVDDQYLLLSDKFEQLDIEINISLKALDLLYRQIIEKDIKNPLWWEQIQLPESL